MPSTKSSEYSLQVVLGRAKRSIPHTRRSMREALAVLREGFDPIVDEASGRDLAELMVLGQTTEKFDFQNMFSVILRVGAEPVVAAVARVFGPLLVEVPLIATRRSARRHGHARVLLEGLADWLTMHGVDQIMLPAHDDALDTWTHGFGFSKLETAEVETIRQHLRMVMFPGTTLMKLPADRKQWPAKKERAPVATDVRTKRKLQVAAPTKSKKNGRKSADGNGVNASSSARMGLRWGGHSRSAAHAFGASGNRASADGNAMHGGHALPPLRPRRELCRSYAEMDRGGDEEEDGGKKSERGDRGGLQKGARGVVEPQVSVKTKSGRVAKRPRQADEALELALQQSAAHAVKLHRARSLKFDEMMQRGLEKVHGMHECELQLPREWRDEVCKCACIGGSGNGNVSGVGASARESVPENGKGGS